MKTEQLQTFPRDLLEKSDAAKKQYFHGYTIAHPRMSGIRKSLLDAIEDAGPDTLIFVFGPAGVGKSTLCVSTHGKLTQKMSSQLDLEPAPDSRDPLFVQASDPSSVLQLAGQFSWFAKRSRGASP